MPSATPSTTYPATVNRKGQTTIPKRIRDLLKLHPGDRIEFVVDATGKVYLYPLNVDVRQLSGLLYRPDRPPVSLEAMDAGIGNTVLEDFAESRRAGRK